LDNIQVANPRVTIAERYLKRWLEIHIHIWVTDAEQYCIFLNRAKEGVNHPGSDGSHLLTAAIDPPYVVCNEGCMQMPVFVNVAKFMESPKRLIPSVIGLQPLNICLDPNIDASQQGFRLGLELTLGIESASYF
jgi:hypothetical protein